MKDQERLTQKFLTDKMHITVQDCDSLLTAYGYELRKGSGSHRVYHKKGDTPVIVVTPKNNKYVKPGYVNLIIKRLNLEE
jgi:predicted RNA binding protein YcfA (HicA-like mRNA interferase family)